MQPMNVFSSFCVHSQYVTQITLQRTIVFYIRKAINCRLVMGRYESWHHPSGQS